MKYQWDFHTGHWEAQTGHVGISNTVPMGGGWHSHALGHLRQCLARPIQGRKDSHTVPNRPVCLGSNVVP